MIKISVLSKQLGRIRGIQVINLGSMETGAIEKQLASSWNVGETKELEDFISRSRELIFSLAESITGDESLAREVVEEVCKALTVKGSKALSNASNDSNSCKSSPCSAVDFNKLETDLHRITYDLSLSKLLQRHKCKLQ